MSCVKHHPFERKIWKSFYLNLFLIYIYFSEKNSIIVFSDDSSLFQPIAESTDSLMRNLTKFRLVLAFHSNWSQNSNWSFFIRRKRREKQKNISSLSWIPMRDTGSSFLALPHGATTTTTWSSHACESYITYVTSAKHLKPASFHASQWLKTEINHIF